MNKLRPDRLAVGWQEGGMRGEEDDEEEPRIKNSFPQCLTGRSRGSVRVYFQAAGDATGFI